MTALIVTLKNFIDHFEPDEVHDEHLVAEALADAYGVENPVNPYI